MVETRSPIPLLPSGTLPDAEVRRRLTTFYRTLGAYAPRVRYAHGYYRRYRDVLDATLLAPRPHVLEVGAGAGIALKAFLSCSPGARAVALDLRMASPGMKKGLLRPVVGDALDLPFASGTFDVVISFEVIEHFPDVERAVREMLRVLRLPDTSSAACPIMPRCGPRWRIPCAAGRAWRLGSAIVPMRCAGGGETSASWRGSGSAAASASCTACHNLIQPAEVTGMPSTTPARWTSSGSFAVRGASSFAVQRHSGSDGWRNSFPWSCKDPQSSRGI